MARTLNGNYTGAAARIDRAEKFQDMVHEAIAAGERDLQELKLDLGDAMAELRELDPLGWEEWFDNDDNIPPAGSFQDHLVIIRERVSNLRLIKSGEYDMIDLENEIKNEEARINQIDQIGDAKLCNKFGSSL